MRINSFTFLCLFGIFVCTFLPKSHAMDTYEIQLRGELSQSTLELLKTNSQLYIQKESPPTTSAGLRHRAEADLAIFLKLLHSQAYYNAKIDLEYDFERKIPLVIIKINTGPIYPLAGFRIVAATGSSCQEFDFNCISLEDLGVELFAPAVPKMIVEAEEELLTILARIGHPLAEIKDREVLADQKTQTIFVTISVDCGATAYFGQTTLSGLCSVKEDYIRKKIAWLQGSQYNPACIDRTQSAIEATGLFSSINISHENALIGNCELPMHIDLIERKHRSIGWGLTYATQRGPGISLEWEHRNVRGRGEKLSFDTDLWLDTQSGRLLYIKPDFLCPEQDLLWTAHVQHDYTKGYTESFFTLSGIIERQFNRILRVSYGAMYKFLRDSHSVTNRSYNLLKAPINIRVSNVDNILDPTYGGVVHIRIIPSLQILKPHFAYCINTLTNTTYFPLTKDARYVFATKTTVGAILGSNHNTIPASERFYEGSDTNLRGYRYLTVSPLEHHHKPIGGRSMMIFATELRVRATESFGWVLFYEIGNVYAPPIPQLRHKLLQSIGWGLRYHTPVGPLRLDFAVPLNPRPHLDRKFQIYFSIGQAF